MTETQDPIEGRVVPFRKPKRNVESSLYGGERGELRADYDWYHNSPALTASAWVSVRLREAADRALNGSSDAIRAEQIAQSADEVQSIKANQEERARLERIQNELIELVRAQRSIMTKLLHS